VGVEVSALGINQPEHEGDHSVLSSSEVMNLCNLLLLSLYVFMVWHGHKGNFMFSIVSNTPIYKLHFLIVFVFVCGTRNFHGDAM
jgi:hypothetical protein